MFDDSDKYIWTDVEVVSYQNGRYEVRVLRNSKSKWVGRLSVLFYAEDPVKFE